MRCALLSVLLVSLALPVRAQNAPVGKGAPANVPAGNAPAAGSPAQNGPAGNLPGGAAPAPGKKLSVRVPPGGEYTVFIKEKPESLTGITERGEVEAPAGLKSATIYVLDKRSGYAGRKTVALGGSTGDIVFASPDFRLIQRVEVKVTGKGEAPIAQGLITLTDGGKNAAQKPILPTAQGVATFDFVVAGEGSVTVTPEGGSATTKSVRLELAPGQSSLTVPVGLPEVTDVLSTPANAPATASGPDTGADPGTGAGPAVNAPAGRELPAPAPQGPLDAIGGFFIFLLQWAVLIAIIASLVLYARKQGLTVETALKKLGIQPVVEGQGGQSLAGANTAVGVPTPGVPPPPPPVVADPNLCQFCGQMKDAAGGCACSALPGRGGGSAAVPAQGSGPRLVGMQGVYMGTVFPVLGAVVLGRDAANSVPLDRDTTASRRHAEIAVESGSYVLRDLGSSNGTFLNGARVNESPLQPGDEIGVGGTRFRFEV